FMGAARRCGNDTRAAGRHAVHVLRDRLHQFLHLGLSARCRRGVDPSGAVFPQRRARYYPPALARVAALMVVIKPLLATEKLSRDFGGLRAVDNVDFSLMPGEIRAIIGPNGAGKTTFVSLVCGRIETSAGKIASDGID